MATILITGGTGLVGQLLQRKLVNKGYSVRILTRNPKKENEFYWNIKRYEIDDKVFDNLDYIVHLAGAGIADKRWTGARKDEILESRTKSTQLLYDTIKQKKVSLRGFISASAIGYYGAITSEKIYTEKDAPASDFLGSVCQAWEEASLTFNQLHIPTTILRIGIVLAHNGGALSKMNTPLVITPIANGKQYIPWIHIDDLTNLCIKGIEDTSFKGTYNAVAPDTQTNFSFSKALAKQTKKVFIPFGIPKFLVKFLFGEMSIILTTGSRMSSKKTEKTGFEFSYNTLDKALKNLLKKA